MRRITSVLSTLALVTGVAACGSGGGGGAVGSAVDDWVDGVCARMMALDHELSAEWTDVADTLGSTTETTATLNALDGYLTSVTGFVRGASKDISRLGAPAIADKNVVLTDVDDLFYTYVSDAADLGTSVTKALGDPATTHDDALRLAGQLGGLGDLADGMQSILTDDRQLRAAYDDSSTCQQWSEQMAAESTVPPPSTTSTVPAPETSAPTTTVAPTTIPPTTTVPATTIPPTTVPPTAPPVTADPAAVARDMYSAAAEEYNPKFQLVWDTFYGDDNFLYYTDAPTYCSQYGTLMREWHDRMNAIPWPADAQDELATHLLEGQNLIGLLDQCAAAPGTKAGEEALLTQIEDEEVIYYGTVDPLRRAVGLPPIYTD